jgi:hypothetical protein
LFGWKPPLLGSQEHKRIRSLNDQGKDDDAFQTWFSFAIEGYTEERLVEFCKCLRKTEKKHPRPKLRQIADKIEAAMKGSTTTMSPTKPTTPPTTSPIMPATTGKWSLDDHCLFMSHSSKNKGTVDEIVKALRELNINVWYDKDEIRTGDDWAEKISEHMPHMYGFICGLSEDFFDSEICKNELQAFKSAQKDNPAIPKKSVFPVIVVEPSHFKGVRNTWRMLLPTQIHYKKWTDAKDKDLFLRDMKEYVKSGTTTAASSMTATALATNDRLIKDRSQYWNECPFLGLSVVH